MTLLSGGEEQIISLASLILRSGGVVAIPTETVYGLAGNISIDSSIKKIYELKNRPVGHPLIVHIESMEQLHEYSINVPRYVEILAKRFWPGPLTFILYKSDKVSNLVTGGHNTVAIRMPNHRLTLDLIKAVGSPLAAPSANKFGRVSPTCPEHVIEEFNGLIDVLDGGECEIGIESTIIDATMADSYKILRPGSITSSDLDAALKDYINNFSLVPEKSSVSKVIAPGSCTRHYSPNKQLIGFNNCSEIIRLMDNYRSIYIIHYSDVLVHSDNFYYRMIKNPSQYAKHLYCALRLGDKSSAQVIAIEFPPREMEWNAVLDRLKRSLSA